MGPIRFLWSSRAADSPTIARMHSHIATEDTRTLTVVLPESDWRALRQAEPDAVGWIQQQIRSRLAPRPASAPIELADEDY